MVKSYSLVLLDRDGVINKNPEAYAYVTNWNDFKFLENSKKAISLLSKKFKIAIISNQQGIAKNLMTQNDLEKIHRKMQIEIKKLGGKINKIYVCPHKRDTCNYRKPNPGMVLEALKDFNTKKDSALFLGDSFSDFETAKNAGIDFIYIKSGLEAQKEDNEKFKINNLKPLSFSSLYEASLWLLK